MRTAKRSSQPCLHQVPATIDEKDEEDSPVRIRLKPEHHRSSNSFYHPRHKDPPTYENLSTKTRKNTSYEGCTQATSRLSSAQPNSPREVEYRRHFSQTQTTFRKKMPQIDERPTGECKMTATQSTFKEIVSGCRSSTGSFKLSQIFSKARPHNASESRSATATDFSLNAASTDRNTPDYSFADSPGKLSDLSLIHSAGFSRRKSFSRGGYRVPYDQETRLRISNFVDFRASSGQGSERTKKQIQQRACKKWGSDVRWPSRFTESNVAKFEENIHFIDKAFRDFRRGSAGEAGNQESIASGAN